MIATISIHTHNLKFRTMKKIFTIVLILLISSKGYAQESNPELLSDECFDKMIIEDITYAIFGENNPVTGIKLDISKPEATISGTFSIKKAPWILLGFDMKGGITDKNFSIFKGLNNFNTAFEIRPNIHFIPSWNSAWFDSDEVPIVRAKNKLIENKSIATRDTFLVVATIYNKHLTNFSNSLYPPAEIASFTSNITLEQKKLLIYFVRKLTNKEHIDLTDRSTVDVILAKIEMAEKEENEESNIKVETYNDAIVNSYKKYKTLVDELPAKSISQQIENAKDAWTKKRLIWFTISPFVKTEFLNFYHKDTHIDSTNTDIDTSYFKKEYPFFYGVSASINFLRVYPKKITHYFKVGIDLAHSNNLISINSFNYETRTTFFSYPNNVTEKTKTGTAYNYKDFKQSFVFQLPIEYYLLPLKTFIPGFYINTNLRFSSLYKIQDIRDREKDIFLMSLEGGIVFNINSKDKIKSILSLSPYVRFEDITDKKRTTVSTGVEESKNDYYKRNLSFGIRVGIPINLPQTQNK